MINRNFTAELHCSYGQVVIADASFSDYPFTSLDEDGWLCTEIAREKYAKVGFKHVAFDFTFRRQDEHRWIYTIRGAQDCDYAGARLCRNRNGWLGLYGSNVVGKIINKLPPDSFFGQDEWKLQPLMDWDGDMKSAESIPFYIRDSFGHRVARTWTSASNQRPVRFLNASERTGEVLTFQLRNIQLT